MSGAIGWIKQNAVIVVFVVLMIAAVVGLPYLAKGMNERIQDDVKDRTSSLKKLGDLEKTQVEDPATREIRPVVVNQGLLVEYQRIVEAQSTDAKRVVEAALAHNRKDFALLEPDGWMEDDGPFIFPKPRLREEQISETRMPQFVDVLNDAYDDLLESVGAVTPPKLEEMQEGLTVAQQQFITLQLMKGDEEALSDEETEKLREHMRQMRLGQYVEAARAGKFYASKDQFPVPVWSHDNVPTLGGVYVWQWEYWITSDLLRALASANKDANSVLDGPVKRVTHFRLYTDALYEAAAKAEDAGSGASAARGSRPPEATSGAGAVGRPPDPKVPIQYDFTNSFTGRSTNALYDVINLELGLIVAKSRLPEVLDAIAAQNFYTVLDMKVVPAEPFEDARLGFVYGDDPVIGVDLVIESVWLRQWTSEHMPDDLKKGLGLPVMTAPSAGDAADDVTT